MFIDSGDPCGLNRYGHCHVYVTVFSLLNKVFCRIHSDQVMYLFEAK